LGAVVPAGVPLAAATVGPAFDDPQPVSDPRTSRVNTTGTAYRRRVVGMTESLRWQ
jgi:hypothetical protein